MLTTGRLVAGLTLAWPSEAAVGAADGARLGAAIAVADGVVVGLGAAVGAQAASDKVMPASTPVIHLMCGVVWERNCERRDGSGATRPGHRGPIRSLGG